MEEQIEGLLKEKEQSTQLAMILVPVVPIVVAGIELSSSLTETKSTLVEGDTRKIMHDLSLQKQDNGKLL